MNGRTKWVMWIAGVAFTLLTLAGGFWTSQVQLNEQNMVDHKVAYSDTLSRVRANEVRFEEILRRLDAIDSKLDGGR